MKQTVVAIIRASLKPEIPKNNEDIICFAQNMRGCELILLSEFERRFNEDEINFEKSIIRFIEAELEVKACK